MKFIQSFVIFFLLAFNSAVFAVEAIPAPDESGFRFFKNFGEDSSTDDSANATIQKELEIIQQYLEKIKTNLFEAYKKHNLMGLSDEQAFDVGLLVSYIANFAVWNAIMNAFDSAISKSAAFDAAHIIAQSSQGTNRDAAEKIRRDIKQKAVMEKTAQDISQDVIALEARVLFQKADKSLASNDTYLAAWGSAFLAAWDNTYFAFGKIKTENPQLKSFEIYLYTVALILQHIASHPEWIDQIIAWSIISVKDSDKIEMTAIDIKAFIDSVKGEGVKKEVAAHINLFHPVDYLEKEFYFSKTLCERLLSLAVTSEDAEHQNIAIKLTAAARNRHLELLPEMSFHEIVASTVTESWKEFVIDVDPSFLDY